MECRADARTDLAKLVEAILDLATKTSLSRNATRYVLGKKGSRVGYFARA
jgi:hypothetical protein